jgi:FKBP-type peptidyl-prolyl cis-trans isomerase
MIIAEDLKDTGLEFNYDALVRGFRDIMENKEPLYSLEDAYEKIDAAFEAAQAEKSERNRIEGEAFLAVNAGRPGVAVTPSGLQIESLTEGSGENPGPADTVLVHYQGAMVDGPVFDSTYEYGEPVWIPLDRVIPGWSEGIRMMKEGGAAKLYIPPNLAYGKNGAGSAIGPNAVLVFDVELITIMREEDIKEVD